MKKYNKGFTLIELLVVIAIIGILASIVLVSLNSARLKGRDAAIKGDLSGMRGGVELYYDAQVPSPTYTGVAVSGTDPYRQYSDALKSMPTGGTSAFTADAVSWAAIVQLNAKTSGVSPVTQWFCVDSNGTSSATTTGTLTGSSPYTCTVTP